MSKIAVLAIEHHHAEEERNLLLVNEKRSIEKFKAEGERFYKLLMDAPAIIAVLKGPEHIYEFANPLYQQVVAGKRNLIGKSIREALPELKAQGIFEMLMRFIHRRTLYRQRTIGEARQARQRNPEDVYFNFIFQPIKNEREQTEGIFIHAVDVTEFVQSRKRAQESEERFRSFVLSSPMPIGIYVGREMRIQTANDAILETWDRSKSVIGKTFREALPELEGQPFYQLLDEVYTTGRTYQATAERVDLFRHGKMEETYYNFTFKALRDTNGEIYGVINTGVEVTDLVEARQKLQEAQDILKVATEVAELGTWHIEMKTGLVYYSDRVTEWFGLPEGSAPFEEVIRVVDENDRQRVEGEIQKAMRLGAFYDVECKCINLKTGQERIVHARGKGTFDQNGEPLRLNGSVFDITS